MQKPRSTGQRTGTTWPELLGFLMFYQAKEKLYRNSSSNVRTATGLVLEYGRGIAERSALQVLVGLECVAELQASGLT
jgi:hypothetical protein